MSLAAPVRRRRRVLVAATLVCAASMLALGATPVVADALDRESLAAEALGAKRFLTQSIIFGYGYRRHGPRPLTEDALFGRPQGDRSDPHLAAMRSTEQQAFGAPEGIALRYGLLYGGDAARLRARPDPQAVGVPAADSRPSSATDVSRILNFCTLPVTVMGNSSTNLQ